MYRYKNLIIKRFAILLALILFIENSIVINPVRIFADNYEDSLVEMGLISNTNQNDTILLCKIEDTYYISIPDLCDCTRATHVIENNKCYVSQGMWSTEFDYDNQTFDDSTQKIDTKIYFIADKYWIPAVEFINYFGGSVLIDEINNTVKCEMPNITAWEALNIDYENTIFDLYDAYGGKFSTFLSFVMAYFTEGLLGNIKGSNGHIKGVYNEALKINPIEYKAVQSYINNIEQSNSEYLEENYYDSIPETVKAIDNSEQTLMVACEFLYGIQSSTLMQLCKEASEGGDSLKSYVLSYNYAVDILEAYRKKEQIVNVIQKVNYATKGVSLLAGSAISTANEMTLNESSDQLVYKVLGKENYKRLGIDTSNNIWVSAANTYKSGWGLFGSNFITESIGLATDAMIEGGLNKLAEGAMGAGAVGLIAGRKLMKKCPWTSSGVEGFHSEYCGIMSAQLQKELVSVLKKSYDKTDFTNKEDLKQLINTMNLYCRVTIAMSEYLKNTNKELGSNHDYWQSKFDDIRDKAVLSLYLMAPFMNEGAVKVIPFRLKNLRRVIAENEDVWLIRNVEEDSSGNKQESTDKAVISELYSKAIADYDKMMLEREQYFNENWPEGYHSSRKTYYSIVDIDNNGIDELILRFDNPNQEHLTNIDSGYGETTFVYTVTAGELTLVIAPEHEGYNPEFAHNSFIRIYKGSNLINNGMQHVPGDHIFFRYQEGKLSTKPVIEITMGGVDPGTWLLNHKEVSREKCEETYNNAVNGDEGYELQLYERPTKTEGQPSSKEDLIEEYKNFIKSQNDGSENTNYLIYDIDKDGYPEVMIERIHTDERRSAYDLYTYESGRFSFVGAIDSPYPHSPGEFASYPKGNGMILSYTFRQLELIERVTFDSGKIEIEEDYSHKVGDGEDWKYYRDKFDQIYQDSLDYKAYINHQYYQSETSSPRYEGSYLLAQSAMDNFTAVYEAFGVEEETDASTEKSDNTFMGISILNQGVDSNIAANGRTYQIRYDSTEVSDEYIGLNLYVNDIAESYRLDAVYYPSIENVYVTDIDISDSYCNIVVVIYGEDDDSSTYLFAFNENDIHLISEFQGRLVPESVSGDGKVLLVFWIGMSIQNYGSFTVRPEIIVHDLTAKQEALHSGRTTYSDEKANYEEGFEVIIKKEISVYSDASMTEAKGIIPAGSSVKCEYTNEYINEPYGRVFYVSDGNTGGYVTSRFFRDCCDDVKFVG